MTILNIVSKVGAATCIIKKSGVHLLMDFPDKPSTQVDTVYSKDFLNEQGSPETFVDFVMEELLILKRGCEHTRLAIVPLAQLIWRNKELGLMHE